MNGGSKFFQTGEENKEIRDENSCRKQVEEGGNLALITCDLHFFRVFFEYQTKPAVIVNMCTGIFLPVVGRLCVTNTSFFPVLSVFFFQLL